ncbi:PaaI family thioesterase [Mycobacterium sp. NPDC004974]
MTVFDQFPKPPCARLLGWDLIDADAQTGRVRVSFQAAHAFCNPGGTIQGGLLAAMLDDTLGPAILVKTGGTHYCATLDLNVHFIAPARPGTLLGEGRVIRSGSTIAFLEGELRDLDGNLIATATATARVTPTDHLDRRPTPTE